VKERNIKLFSIDGVNGKRSIFLETLIVVLTCLVFSVAVYGSYRAYLDNEREVTAEHFSAAASGCRGQLNEYFKGLAARVGSAGEILSVSGIDEESAARLFEKEFKSTGADSALLISGGGNSFYGSLSKSAAGASASETFSKAAAKTLQSGVDAVTDIVACGDGIGRFGLASRFELPDGSKAAIMLIFPESQLEALLTETVSGGDGSFCIANTDGHILAAQPGIKSWFKDGRIPLGGSDAFRSGLITVSSAEGGKYYVFGTSVGLSNWNAVYAAPKELIDNQAQVGIVEMYSICIAALVLILMILARSMYINYMRVNRLQLFLEKFRIATSQSSRAAFEYNSAADRLTLISESEYISLPKPYVSLAELETLICPDDITAYKQVVAELKRDGATSKNIRLSHIAGSETFKWYNIAATRLTDLGRGKPVTVGTAEDIDEREKERIILYERATTDGLTGLCNRAETERRIKERLSNLETNQHAAFALIDLDDFKNVNDGYGHNYGDKMLVFFSDQLRTTFRFGDIIGRLGGDEFVVYMTLTSELAVVEHRFRELREHMETERALETEKMPGLTCSVGCIMVSSGETFEALYKRADAALYESKMLGKAQAVIT